jgi:signal transduction histidine kinase
VAIPPDQQAGALRRRYAELDARYRKLVKRMDDQTQAEAISNRLSRLALDRSSSAVAFLRRKEVVMANSRWHELAQPSGHATGWTIAGHETRLHPDLMALVNDEIARRRQQMLWTLRCDRAEPEQALRLTFERVPSADGVGLVLLRGDDITDLLRRERAWQELRNRQAQRERIVALGLLAHGMAHDLGNTVNALGLHLQVIEHLSPPETRVRLEPLGRAVDSMRGTLARLDRFSGWRARPDPVPVSLAYAVESAADLVRVQLLASSGRPAVRLELDVPERLPDVPGQIEDLTHVFVNLILNARDAMPNGGTVTIRAYRRGQKVLVTVEDQGSGFAPADLPRVFEPLFTTKGAAGHGLGLALAHATINGAGGSIRVANRDGGGAIITIELPLAARSRRRR